MAVRASKKPSHHLRSIESIASPDFSISTSHYASKNYYPGALDIARMVLKQSNKDSDDNLRFIESKLIRKTKHDVPNPEYKGPF